MIKKFYSFNENLDSETRIQDISNGIVRFLRDNKISTWEEMDNNEFTRNVINKIIDKSAKTFKEVGEIKFLMKLELYNIKELKGLLKSFLEIEDYRKCKKIKDRIDILQSNLE